MMTGAWSIIIGGLEFRQSAWPRTGFYWTGKISGLGKGDIRTSSQINSGANGGYIGEQFLGMRQLPLQLVIHSDDVAEVEARCKAVEAALPINTYLDVVLVTPSGSRYFLRRCKVVQCDPEMESLNLVDYTVQLLAEDSTFYDYTNGVDNVVTLRKVSMGGITWDSEGFIWSSTGLVWTDGESNSVINNLGDTAVYPLITITGAATNPALMNMATGRLLSLTITTTATDIIEIDFLSESVTMNGANIYNYLDAEDFWSVEPGQNEISFTTTSSGDTATATLGWNNGYAGIM